MNINCLAENYSYKKEGDSIIVYNDYYEKSKGILLVSAIMDILIPDNDSFNVPIAIQVCEEGSKEIIIDEKLNVIGSEQYKYFIPRMHYEKWKSSYAIIYCLLMILQLFVSGILLYIFVIPAKFNILAGCMFGCVFALFICLGFKLKKQKQLMNKYELK